MMVGNMGMAVMISPLSHLPFHPDWVMATVALQDAELCGSSYGLYPYGPYGLDQWKQQQFAAFFSCYSSKEWNMIWIWYEYELNMIWNMKLILKTQDHHLSVPGAFTPFGHTVAQMILARQARRAVSHCMIVFYGFSTFQVVWCDTDI